MGVHGLILVPLLGLSGFAYVIWIIASKETGAKKNVGLVIAALMALAVLIALVAGGIRCQGHRGMHGMKCEGMPCKFEMKQCPVSQSNTVIPVKENLKK